MTNAQKQVIDITLGIRPDDVFISNYLRERREQYQLTHELMASLIGVSRSTLINFEKARSRPDDNQWLRILLTFNDHPRFFLQPR